MGLIGLAEAKTAGIRGLRFSHLAEGRDALCKTNMKFLVFYDFLLSEAKDLFGLRDPSFRCNPLRMTARVRMPSFGLWRKAAF
jgi:hypothetical protein